jgi:hypothetical protein
VQKLDDTIVSRLAYIDEVERVHITPQSWAKSLKDFPADESGWNRKIADWWWHVDGGAHHRQMRRADYSAMRDFAPAGSKVNEKTGNWEAAQMWYWNALSKDNRQDYRSKYISLGFADDVGREADVIMRKTAHTLKNPIVKGAIVAVSTAFGAPIKPEQVDQAADAINKARDIVHAGKNTAHDFNDAITKVRSDLAVVVKANKAGKPTKEAAEAAQRILKTINDHHDTAKKNAASALGGTFHVQLPPHSTGGKARKYALRITPAAGQHDTFNVDVLTPAGGVQRSYKNLKLQPVS